VRAVRARSVGAVSNALGLVQVSLLVTRCGFSRTTDAYVVLFAFGQAVLAVWVQGIVYPARLAVGRDAGGWRRTQLMAAGAALLFQVVAAGILVLQGFPMGTVLPLALPLVVAQSAGAASAVLGVRHACAGRPALMAGLAAPANALACVALLASPQGAVAAQRMCWGLAVGNVTLLGLLTARSLGGGDANAPTATSPPLRGRCHWLVVNAAVGYAGGLLLQTAAAELPRGTATVYGIVTRVVGAAVGIGVNAALPALVHWSRDGAAEAHHLLGRVLRGAAPLLALLAAGAVLEPRYVRVAAAGAGWLALAAAAALVAQVTYAAGAFQAFRQPALITLPATAACVAVALREGAAWPLAVALIINATLTLLPLLAVNGWRAESRQAVALALVSATAAATPVPSWLLLVAAVTAVFAQLHRPPRSRLDDDDGARPALVPSGVAVG